MCAASGESSVVPGGMARIGAERPAKTAPHAQQLCASCHQQSGRGGGNILSGPTSHDANTAFFVGTGQVARQSLESCVSCHAERDCTACHAAQGGRRFPPHGPGFDSERLPRRNPEMCIACHGRAIPTRGAP